MKLNLGSLKNREQWLDKGYALPEYDVSAVRQNTKEAPEWVHFGAGNIFRAYLGSIAQRLLNGGYIKTGICAFSGFDTEVVDKVFRPFDNLTVGVTLLSSGTVKKEVLGAVCEALTIADGDRMKRIFSSASLKMVSFTITEKGYAVKAAENDAVNGPDRAGSVMGYLTALLLERFNTVKAPVALVSMDNCSHNGDKLRAAVRFVAENWIERGFVPAEFGEWINKNVSFPWTMIDKITPRPDKNVMELLKKDGFEDADLIVTRKNSYIASFVNAEEKEYLVIEDDFPNGRLPLDKAGVYFTDRETVEKTERMKVTTCLNPLHTCLAVFGCLLGYKTIWEEMNDADLTKLVNRIGYTEGLPVVTDPGIMAPADFLREVLEVRLPNSFLPDTPQRIATDTSQKLSVRFGETIRSTLRSGRDVSALKGIALTEAGWLRYLMGADDTGAEMPISPDPRLEEMKTRLGTLAFGNNENARQILLPILSDESIFGTDLVKAGMAEDIIAAFMRMNAAPGSVRNEIHSLVK